MCKQCGNPKAAHLPSLEDARKNPLFTEGADNMPDGIHAKIPKFWVRKRKYGRLTPEVSEVDFGKLRQEMDVAYDNLPDPKPDYMDWASLYTRKYQFWELFRTAHLSPRVAERTRASESLLEYTKQKPKQEFVLPGQDASKLDNLQILRKALELNGQPPELADALISGKINS